MLGVLVNWDSWIFGMLAETASGGSIFIQKCKPYTKTEPILLGFGHGSNLVLSIVDIEFGPVPMPERIYLW